MKFYFAYFFIIVIVAVAAVEGQKWSDYNKVNSKYGRTSGYMGENEDDNSSDSSSPAKSQQGKNIARGGIGGWGIIAITLTIIFSGVGVYYFVLFYPIVCKKERMYDVMEMTAV